MARDSVRVNLKSNAVGAAFYSGPRNDLDRRFSEIIFGLIMVLSFTCAISVGTAGREDVREVLVGALGG